MCRTDDANEFLNGVSVAANNKALYWWTKFIGKKRSNTRAISDTVSACRMLTALHILLCPERSTAERFDMLTDNVEYMYGQPGHGGGRVVVTMTRKSVDRLELELFHIERAAEGGFGGAQRTLCGSHIRRYLCLSSRQIAADKILGTSCSKL